MKKQKGPQNKIKKAQKCKLKKKRRKYRNSGKEM